MAKINWQDIGELTAVDAESVKKAIVIPAKEALRQVRFAMTGNLTIRDNQYAAIVTLGYTGNSTQTLTHATEYTFQNPLKTTPIGFTPIKCVDANGSAVAIPSFQFNTSRTDGLAGLTPYFKLPEPGAAGAVGETVNSFVAVNSGVTLSNGVCANVTSVTVTAGKYAATGIVTYYGGPPTGTVVISSVSLTSATRGTSGDNAVNSPTMPTANTEEHFSVPSWPVTTTAASTTIYLTAQCNFSAGSVAAGGRLTLIRIASSTAGLTGIVTGILWGG